MAIERRKGNKEIFVQTKTTRVKDKPLIPSEFLNLSS